MSAPTTPWFLREPAVIDGKATIKYRDVMLDIYQVRAIKGGAPTNVVHVPGTTISTESQSVKASTLYAALVPHLDGAVDAYIRMMERRASK